jgi:hypothetical protein
MDSPDQDFLKEYKPLHVPHKYDAAASLQDNVVYALAQLQYATAPEVAAKMAELDPNTDLQTHFDNTEGILKALFDKGLIKANDNGEEKQYNLSKILAPNSGKADDLF